MHTLSQKEFFLNKFCTDCIPLFVTTVIEWMYLKNAVIGSQKEQFLECKTSNHKPLKLNMYQKYKKCSLHIQENAAITL